MSSTGIRGIAFSPYVGPWLAAGPVLFNTYTLDQVTQLLTPVAKLFPLIATYGQGTFVWQGVAQIQGAISSTWSGPSRDRLRHQSSQELRQRGRTDHRERMFVGTKFDAVGDPAHQLCEVPA